MAENHPASPTTASGAEPQRGETACQLAGVNGALIIDLDPRFVPQVGSSMILTFTAAGKCEYAYLPAAYDTDNAFAAFGAAEDVTQFRLEEAERERAARIASGDASFEALAVRAAQEVGDELVRRATGVDLAEARERIAAADLSDPMSGDEALARLGIKRP